MKKEVRIGVFGVLMILCAWAGIRFLSGIDIFSRNAEYIAVYDQVNGMQEASPVLIRGVKVGTVTAIEFDPQKSDKVALCLTVQRKYAIPRNSLAKMVSSSIMGGKSIEIELGNGSEVLESGDTILSSATPDMMESLSSQMNPILERVTTLADELTTTLEGVNMIVEQNADNIKGLTTHLNSIASNIDNILGEEREGLKQTLKGVEEFSTALGRNSERMDSLMTNLATFSERLASAEVVENLDRTLADLNALLSGMESGEGTLGQLAKDKALYDNLASASENLSRLLQDLREHPSRYVHFSVFGRSEAKELKRAAKQEEKRLRDSLRRAERESKRE